MNLKPILDQKLLERKLKSIFKMKTKSQHEDCSDTVERSSENKRLAVMIVWIPQWQ